MPKIELHCHLSGAVTPEDMAYLAAHFPVRGEALPLEELRRRLTVTEDCTCLQDFLDKFTFAVSYLTCPEALEWAAAALVRRASEAGVVYQEIRFSPWLLAGTHIPWEAAIEAVLSGFAQGERM